MKTVGEQRVWQHHAPNGRAATVTRRDLTSTPDLSSDLGASRSPEWEQGNKVPPFVLVVAGALTCHNRRRVSNLPIVIVLTLVTLFAGSENAGK